MLPRTGAAEIRVENEDVRSVAQVRGGSDFRIGAVGAGMRDTLGPRKLASDDAGGGGEEIVESERGCGT